MAAAAACAGANETDAPAWSSSSSPKKKRSFFNFGKQQGPEQGSRIWVDRQNANKAAMSQQDRIEDVLERLSAQVEQYDRRCADGLEDLRRSCGELLERLGGSSNVDPANPREDDRDRARGQTAPSPLKRQDSLVSSLAGFGQREAPSPLKRQGSQSSLDRRPEAVPKQLYTLNGAGTDKVAKMRNSLGFFSKPSGLEHLALEAPFDPNPGQARTSWRRTTSPGEQQPLTMAEAYHGTSHVQLLEPNTMAEAAEVAETAPLIPKGTWCLCEKEDLPSDDLMLSQVSKRATDKDVRRGFFIETVTNFLDEPESSTAASLFHKIMPPLVFVTVAVTLSQSFVPPLLQGRQAAIIEACIEVFFFTEIFMRVTFAPNLKRAFLSPYNQLDFLASLALALRAYYGMDPPMEAGCMTSNFLLCAVPALRIMKVLRRFGQFQLLLKAFTEAFEALPILLYTLAVFVLVFSSLIYVVEPRDNISCLPEAVWLAIVTMSTVGYGDITPVSTLGTVIVSNLVIISALYMAMPLGIIGYTFTQIWKDRDRILLMLRTQERLRHWGYEAEDILTLFQLADENHDGELDIREFSNLVQTLKIGLRDDRIMELFTFIDKDGGGTIDDLEFVRAIFPADFHAIYGNKGADTELGVEGDAVRLSARSSVSEHRGSYFFQNTRSSS